MRAKVFYAYGTEAQAEIRVLAAVSHRFGPNPSEKKVMYQIEPEPGHRLDVETCFAENISVEVDRQIIPLRKDGKTNTKALFQLIGRK